jgi:hypothetical protein
VQEVAERQEHGEDQASVAIGDLKPKSVSA